jgi:hypothetical protein
VIHSPVENFTFGKWCVSHNKHINKFSVRSLRHFNFGTLVGSSSYSSLTIGFLGSIVVVNISIYHNLKEVPSAILICLYSIKIHSEESGHSNDEISCINIRGSLITPPLVLLSNCDIEILTVTTTALTRRHFIMIFFDIFDPRKPIVREEYDEEYDVRSSLILLLLIYLFPHHEI